MPRGRKPKATTIDELKEAVKAAEKNYEIAKNNLKEAQQKLETAQKEEEIRQQKQLLDIIQMWSEVKGISGDTEDLIEWFNNDAEKIHAENHPEETEE